MNAPVVHFSVDHYDRVDLAPRNVQALLFRAQAELIENGQTDLLVGDDERVIAFTDPLLKEVVGILVFEIEDEQAWVTLTWVRPAVRRNGAFRQMWEELRHQLNGDLVSTVFMGTHVSNGPAQEAAKSVGLKPQYIIFQGEIE